MSQDIIRFFVQDDRVCVGCDAWTDIVDLGPVEAVREAMVRFLDERTEAPETPADSPVQGLPPSPVAPPSPSTEPETRVEVDRREERHELTIMGRIVTRAGPRDVTVLDLSESGCRFADRLRGINSGDQITIKIGPIGPVRATARWSRQGYVGIAFENPLYPSVLDHIRSHFDIRQ